MFVRMMLIEVPLEVVNAQFVCRLKPTVILVKLLNCVVCQMDHPV
jgi:hypothetical protein